MALRLKPLWPLIRPSCAPSLIIPLPSDSPKCQHHTWTNLRWSRTRLWGSRPAAIKRPRRPTSEPRLGVLPLRGVLRVMLSAVLCQLFSTLTPQSPNRHLPSRPPPPQGYSPSFMPPHFKRPASKKWDDPQPELGTKYFFCILNTCSKCI